MISTDVSVLPLRRHRLLSVAKLASLRFTPKLSHESAAMIQTDFWKPFVG